VLAPGPRVAAAPAAFGGALARMSLEQLSRLVVTSVSKSPQPLSHAPAAIYVITHGQIVRSGAKSLAQALRLAPNLQVIRLSSSDYMVSARGFGGAPQAQNFSNKMLILIDGRSVYSPLFSGVYLDAQGLLMRDVERIEVISGPGAALWGANAVNGVINVITRSALSTRGTYASVSAGNHGERAAAQLGGRLGAHAAVRVYAKSFRIGPEQLAGGASALDAWYKTQAGFRADWAADRQGMTLEGDAYRALQGNSTPGDGLVTGADLLARWRREFGRSRLQLQAYYDDSERRAPLGGLAFVLHTYDLELQQNFDAGAAGELVWGAGERLNAYAIHNTASLAFLPPRRNLTLGNLFLQDTVPLGDTLSLTAGTKLEDDPFAGWQLQPDVRLAWTPRPALLLWGAVSRAERSPTPFETDVLERIGTLVALQGNPDFRPETVTAYELGYRGRPLSSLTLSVSGFYNVYDDLRTIEPSPAFFPLTWGNGLRGHTYGVEAWADWQVTRHWRLEPGVRTLTEELRFQPGASGLLGPAVAADDPHEEATLTSSLQLPAGLTFDATLHYTGALPNPALPGYWELSSRIAWRLSRDLELSLAGSNLLHARHLEFPAPYGEYIRRSVWLRIDWRRH
jgi:iron complex outermembrane receptor protein